MHEYVSEHHSECSGVLRINIFLINKCHTSLLLLDILIILSIYSRALSWRPVCHRNMPAKYSAISPHDWRSCLSFASSSCTASLSTSFAFLCAFISANVEHKRTSGLSLIPSNSLMASDGLSVNNNFHLKKSNLKLRGSIQNVKKLCCVGF